MPLPSESWSTQQLVEFVALISSCTSEQEAYQHAVERTADALEAEIGVILRTGEIAASIGFGEGATATAELQAVDEGVRRLELPRLGQLWVSSAVLEGDPSTKLLVGRLGEDGFTQEESDLLRGVASVLALTLRMLRTLDHERDLRRRSQREVKNRKRVERELAHQALHDLLTGLPNRTLLLDRAAQAIDRAWGSSAVVAALYVDLDHFKALNDSLGHRLGDELLLSCSRRLQEAVPVYAGRQRQCTFARVGGDEFVVLCDSLDDEHGAITLAQLLHEKLREPFVLNGNQMSLTASIGIAVAGAGTAEPGAGAENADALLRDADVAMSRAKERGRDRYEVFDEGTRTRLAERLELEADLRAGLKRDELLLAYQPVVAVEDATVVALEALVRWQHPSRGLLPPGSFIPLAEESEMIVAVGEWVIDEVCEQLRSWRADGIGSGLRVSVNVSARQLTPEFVEFLAATLTRTGIDPGQIALEITETLLIEQPDISAGVLHALKAIGVGIVLDDFGTGYSSLSYLKSFPLDQIKLDRSFVGSLVDEPRSAKIVSATIEMARALGMTVVAEGVETSGQLTVLQRLRCDYAQGFHFAAPEPPDMAATRIHSRLDPERDRAELASIASPVYPEPSDRDAPVDPDEARRRLFIGKVAGLFFCTGGLLTIAASLLLNRSAGMLVTLGLVALSLASGAVCLVIPWERLSERWIHATAVIAIAEAVLSVFALGHPGVFSWYYLLIAAAVAYAFRGRSALLRYALLLSGAMALPLIYAPNAQADGVPRTLLGISVLWATTAATAALREGLEDRQAELRELAVRDPLTSVGNYRLLHDRLEYELRRHKRLRRTFAVLLIDLDQFKEVNERFGHGAGDEALRRVARVLSGAVRQQDTVIRQGGDEFAVLAPETDAEAANDLAARVSREISSTRLAEQRLTATIGISIYPHDGDSAEVLMGRADTRLLANKANIRPARLIASDTLAPQPQREAELVSR